MFIGSVGCDNCRQPESEHLNKLSQPVDSSGGGEIRRLSAGLSSFVPRLCERQLRSRRKRPKRSVSHDISIEKISRSPPNLIDSRY